MATLLKPLENIDDVNTLFIDSIRILRENNINYWVSHGTLLGIIRENRILPWDHDLDFSVWDHEVDQKTIVDLFEASGYKQEVVYGEMDCLHFVGGYKKIDISFYKVYKNIASVKWIIPSGNKLKQICQFILRMWSHNAEKLPIVEKYHLIKYLLYLFIKSVKYLMPNKFKRHINNNVANYMKKCYDYGGYSYPKSLLDNLGTIEFLGEKILVPSDSEKYLEYTYGKDWNIPKKDYIWHEEASNLIKL